MAHAPPSKYVTPAKLRTLFNEGRYFERLQEGEFVVGEMIERPGPARFPAGTRSQVIRYLDQTGRTVAIVHQYGHANGDPIDGTLPDPKYLFHEGVRYRPSAIAPHAPLG